MHTYHAHNVNRGCVQLTVNPHQSTRTIAYSLFHMSPWWANTAFSATGHTRMGIPVRLLCYQIVIAIIELRPLRYSYLALKTVTPSHLGSFLSVDVWEWWWEDIWDYYYLFGSVNLPVFLIQYVRNRFKSMVLGCGECTVSKEGNQISTYW